MKSKKQIYLLYSCDQWKSRSSMNLIMATTSQTKMCRFIKKKILDEEIVYGSSEHYNERAAAQAFVKDWNTLPRDEINVRLEEYFLDYTYDGEEL